MGRPRRNVRSSNTQEGAAARDFGSRLYNAVFRDSVRDALRRSLDAAAKPDHGLRLRLRLENAPVLAGVREALTDVLAQSRIVQIDLPEWSETEDDPWLRFAGMWQDLSEEEWSRFQSAVTAARHAANQETHALPIDATS